MKISRASAKNAKELYPLIVLSQTFQKKELEGKPLTKKNSFLKGVKETFNKWISEKDKAYFIAFDDNNKIVGYVLCMYDDTGTLSDLFVKPQMRGKKIAQALMERGEHWLEEKKIKQISLAVHAGNKIAVRLYEQAGYRRQKDDYLLMEKKIK